MTEARTLLDLCELIVDCEHKTAPLSEDGFPSIRTPNIGRGRLLLDKVNRVSQETFEKWTRRAVPRPGDLIIAREAPVGNVAIIPDGLNVCLGQRTVLVRPDSTEVDPLFLCYHLLGDEVQARFHATSTGSTVAHLNMKDIRGLPVSSLPDRTVQERIAAILGAYDGLIEVNWRRVALLEEMARGLFEEWFVRFRFPGHEDVPIFDTPDGPLPEGWEWGTASALVEFDPKTKVPKEGEKPFISMGLLDTSTSLIEPFEYRSGNSGAKFRNDDTVFARITPCLENGKTGLVRQLPHDPGVGFGSTEFIVIRGERAGPAFAYCLARNPAFRDHAQSSMSGASGRQRARTDSVAAFEMGVPNDDELLGRFEQAAWPMLQLIGELGNANQKLAASRDLLLPRLICGQLSVEATEHELEEAA